MPRLTRLIVTAWLAVAFLISYGIVAWGASSIDDTQPDSHCSVTTATFCAIDGDCPATETCTRAALLSAPQRANWVAAKSEIETLQGHHPSTTVANEVAYYDDVTGGLGNDANFTFNPATNVLTADGFVASIGGTSIPVALTQSGTGVTLSLNSSTSSGNMIDGTGSGGAAFDVSDDAAMTLVCTEATGTALTIRPTNAGVNTLELQDSGSITRLVAANEGDISHVPNSATVGFSTVQSGAGDILQAVNTSVKGLTVLNDGTTDVTVSDADDAFDVTQDGAGNVVHFSAGAVNEDFKVDDEGRIIASADSASTGLTMTQVGAGSTAFFSGGGANQTVTIGTSGGVTIDATVATPSLEVKQAGAGDYVQVTDGVGGVVAEIDNDGAVALNPNSAGSGVTITQIGAGAALDIDNDGAGASLTLDAGTTRTLVIDTDATITGNATSASGAINITQNGAGPVALFQTSAGLGLNGLNIGQTGQAVFVTDSASLEAVEITQEDAADIIHFSNTTGANVVAKVENDGTISQYGDTGGGLGQLKVKEVQVAASGASVTATSFIPAGSFLLALTVHPDSIGTSTDYDVGISGDIAQWCDGVLVANDCDITDYTVGSIALTDIIHPTATDVLITANGGSFSAGTFRLTAHYFTATAATVP